MEIRNALERSCDQGIVCIIKEALFCKVYQESAWRFTSLIKPYKISCKYVKKLDLEVVSVGFPKTELPNILNIALQKGYELEHDEPMWLTIKTSGEPDIQYAEWKQNIVVSTAGSRSLSDKTMLENTDEWSVLKAIETYSVVDSTPMQSMQFLVDIQNRIKKIVSNRTN